MNDSQKKNYISLFALDIPVEEILNQVGVASSDVLEARIDDGNFDRECESAVKHQRSLLLGRISKVEADLLAGKFAFGTAGADAKGVIKSIQWRIEYIDKYAVETTAPQSKKVTKSDADIIADYFKRVTGGVENGTATTH